MANYSRDKMEKDNGTAMGLGAAAGLGLISLAAACITKSKNNKEQAQVRAAIQTEIEKCNSAISDIDNKIANLRSQFMGSFLYSDQIAQLQSQRNDWVATRNKLMNL